MKSQAIVGHEGGYFRYCQMLFANMEHQITEIAEAVKIGRLKKECPFPFLTLGKNALSIVANDLLVPVQATCLNILAKGCDGASRGATVEPNFHQPPRS